MPKNCFDRIMEANSLGLKSKQKQNNNKNAENDESNNTVVIQPLRNFVFYELMDKCRKNGTTIYTYNVAIYMGIC